ncbi:alpha/beta hydrolase [Hymenobacter negativus]|uniref:Alpha/beta hydrolase n=1 Tax=Hymenobacter negativus TaxID=2795026 RepID=A0ABS3QIX7_9BACT|nr:alpha/beta hydrolase [Hymenobacter negativus]MBO2011194.1 alpha/beta hydrolase [Hymenobacter negativus]
MKSLFLAISLLASIQLAHAQAGPPIPTDSTVKVIPVPKGFTKQIDVVYTRVDGWDGRMDLYLPPAGGAPSPIIINIHGGGWNKGTKESQSGFNGFFKKGYAVANMEYRLSQQAPAPAAVEDTRCALIYLINNAKKLNIDPNKIVIMGASAGAHLALVGGLLENDHRFDTNCPTKSTVKVLAIVDKYGITSVGTWPSKSGKQWLGPHFGDEAFIQSVSPLYLVKKTSPPTFIVHGDADPTVAYSQSVDLHKKLMAMGVKTEFITVSGGLHGKFPAEENKRVNDAIMKFLTEVGI